jgi:hypothetical protein
MFAHGKVDASEAARKGAQARWGVPQGADRERQEGTGASPGGFDLLAHMEALLQRPASQDRGETQKGLRKWYKADVKGFMGQLAGLKKEQMRIGGDGKPCPECARRKAEEEEETDEGSDRAIQLCHDILGRANVEVHIGSAIAEKWWDLSMQQKVAILDMTGVPHTFEVNPGMKDTPTLSVLTEYGTVNGANRQPDRKEGVEDGRHV